MTPDWDSHKKKKRRLPEVNLLNRASTGMAEEMICLQIPNFLWYLLDLPGNHGRNYTHPEAVLFLDDKKQGDVCTEGDKRI